MKKAIVLCSGGLDSVTTAYYVKNKLMCNAMTILFFNYGQKSLKAERKCARDCAKELKAKFIEMPVPELASLSTSLINLKGKTRKITKKELKDTAEEIKKWYVPCRNLIFLSYALALAESRYIGKKEKSDIFVGFKCEGKEPYPDATREFIDAMNNVARTSCAYSIRIKAPLIEKDKEDIVLLGKNLGVDFTKTHSCYTKNKHCGQCLACQLRKAGFYWANMPDPTLYER